MSYASDIIDLRRCRAVTSGCCSGPRGPPGPGITPSYASFISMRTQEVLPNPSSPNPPNSVAITYDSRTIGTFNVVGGIYPNSQIQIPNTGVYKVLFSAQCDSTSGIHYLEIFPVINGQSVPNSNTRIRIDGPIESCLTVEYFLSFNANDILQLRMTGDRAPDPAPPAPPSTYPQIVTISGHPTSTPPIPAIPSIIVTIQQIA